MDIKLTSTSLATKLALASILMTTVMVHGLPLLPFGQDGLRDFSSSSSSSSSGATSSGDLKDEMAALGGLSPQQAYILALALLVQNEDSQLKSSLFNTAARGFSRGNSFEKRVPHKRFDFGMSGLDNVDYIISSMNNEPKASRSSDYAKLREKMLRAG